MTETETRIGESAAGQETGRSDTLVAVLIALTTLVGATLTWRSSVAGDAAGDADYAGLRSVVNAEETRARSAVNAYEHYSAFASFHRQDELARLMQQEGSRAAGEMRVQAKATRRLFEAKFATRDGTYAVTREMSAAWADAAREKDLNPAPQFGEADRLRAKSLGLIAAVTIVAIALVFFALVAPLGPRLVSLNVGLGAACLLTGSALGLYYELLVR